MTNKLKLRLKIFALACVLGMTSIFLPDLLASPKKQDRRISLNVTVPQAQIILKALSKLSIEEAGDLFMEIQNQATVQLNPQPQRPTPKQDTTKKKQ